MDNLIIKAIFSASLVLGLIKFGSLDSKGWKWQQKFAERVKQEEAGSIINEKEQ